jgi:site-specific DNA-cytosine methylase
VKALELFGGGGGAWQGLTAAGVDVVRSIEYDEAAHNVAVAAGCPSVLGDVRDLTLIEDLAGSIDLLWSSFPCQAFSSAGKRKGASDERNGWPWTVAAIDCIRPTWVMCENVSGLLTHSGEHCGDPLKCPGCYFHGVILPELRERFAWVGWSLSDAADFGTPQHRRRVCIVAGPRAVRWPTTTHAKPSECLGLFATRKPWATVGQALGLTGGHLAGGRNSEANPTQEKGVNVATEPAPTLGGMGNAMLDRPSPSVVTSEVKGSGAGANPQKRQRASDALFLGTGRRRLTVSECRILMGWHERYDAILADQTKTAAYRVLGNGCVPAWVEAHARSVLSA